MKYDNYPGARRRQEIIIMWDNHELYRIEYEERVRNAIERNRLRELLPIKPNWLIVALNQIRIFLF